MSCILLFLSSLVEDTPTSGLSDLFQFELFQPVGLQASLFRGNPNEFHEALFHLQGN